MRIQRTILFWALAALLSGRVARADGDDYVECKGEAAVEGDVAIAKDRAYKAALRDCVERKLGTFVVSNTQTQDFQAVRDTVLTSAQGFVTDAKELESRESEGTYVVRLKAKVIQAKIDEAAKARNITLAAMKYPRIALIISEQLFSSGSNGGPAVAVEQRLAENAIMEAWKASGSYTFVDLDALKGKVRAVSITASPSADQVREYANLLDADILVFGTAVASKIADLGTLANDPLAKGPTKGGCRVNISVRAFSPDSGEVLATSTAGFTGLAPDELPCAQVAMKKASFKLSEDLEKKLLVEWNKRTMGSSRIRLKVKGIDYDGVRTLKTQLSSGFKAIQAVAARPFQDDVADFDLTVTSGDAEALADAFAAAFAPGKSKLKLKVVGVTSNTITLQAK